MATEPVRRRIRALSIMERVKRLETERQAQETGALRDRMRGFEAEKQTLIRRLSGESRTEGIEGAAYLGRFIRSIRAEVERLDTEIARLRPDLDRAEEALRAALAEQKRYEILMRARIAEDHRATRKREAARMDEYAKRAWIG